MMTGFEIVWMILDVRVKLPTILKQHRATNVVERPPLLFAHGSAQLVFSDHLCSYIVGHGQYHLR